MSMKVLPITLLTGYLGSGKTTLINHILNNQKGYKIAVIVNDIGEVNIDAELIEKGGVVTERDDNLVALSNGCICCNLKADLIQQIAEIYDMNKFDYLLIEASGICEPIPIAQSIITMNEMMIEEGFSEIVRLDSIITVTDALRLVSEFGCGDTLVDKSLDSEDIGNLIIQQLEFCNIVVLNKTDCVTKEELEKVKTVIKQLQPHAEIIETNYAKVDLDDILDINLFDFEKVISSAGWVEQIENHDEVHDHSSHHSSENHECCCHEHNSDDECCCHHEHHHEKECHCHHQHGDDCHCGCHSHGESEYGITTFVYYIREGFNRNKFINFVNDKFPKEVIRCKGVLYFSDQDNMSYLFEQAGIQKNMMEAGEWFAVLPKKESDKLRKMEPKLEKDWDSKYGDRMVKLVFIGQHMNKDKIISDLDMCIEK